MTDVVVHPRPQLQRAGWEDLSGPWQFAYDDDEVGLAARWYDDESVFDREIVVPYPPESRLSGIGDPSYHPVLWYRRTFAADDLAAGERLLIHFGAVDYRARVWVNGSYVGEHEGGHTPFFFDVTDVVDRSAAEQVVVVRAEDRPLDMTQPRGKQDWRPEPHVIWYHRTSGIWQPVWIERVPALHVAELHWTPDVVARSITLDLRLSQLPTEPAAVTVRLRLEDQVLAETTVRVTDIALRQVINLPAEMNEQDNWLVLWSPEKPTLLDAKVTVRAAHGATDEVTSYVGFRSVGYADGRFLLNNHPYFPRMVLGQNYWPESHLAAPSADALRREVELIKELGFNGVRVHQKIEDPRFLYWCDRLGLLAWGEMPSTYVFSPTAAERLTREWLDAVRRDRSHPCIVTWVPLNESWGVIDIPRSLAQQHFATGLYNLTKALDPTRPVISNDGWEHTESDIWGIHDYAPDGSILTERYGTAEAITYNLREGRPGGRRVLLLPGGDRGQPVMITEFGGLSFRPETGEKWFGYSAVASSEDLLAKYRELVVALLDAPDVAGFCYTQLTDTLQETNGLLTEAREPKIPLELVREVMSLPARAIGPEVVDAARRAAERPRES